ncbi:hypothetical protein SLE2022_291500 [Rubroshorea leprosula]
MERYDELRHVLLHIAEIWSKIPKMVTYVKNKATEMVEVLSSWKTNIGNQHGKYAIFKSSTSTRVKKRGTKVPNCPRIVYDDPNITEKLPMMNPTYKKRRGRPTKNRIKTLVEKVFMRKKKKKGNEASQSAASGEQVAHNKVRSFNSKRFTYILIFYIA